MEKSKLTRADIELIITSGSYICKKLKIIYPQKSWLEISGVFTDVKNKTRNLYPEKNEVEFLRELEKYTVDDLQEVIASENSAEKSGSISKKIEGMD